jgi:hypothetical protein
MDLEFRAWPQVRSGGGGDNGVLTNIGPYFRRLASPRRLLVVGEAGAGKTVLAVYLLLDQLRDRDALTDHLRIEAPVPVRVNVAGWDGGGDFTSWLASRLGIDYALNPKVALALTEAGYILPILDGLDEMDPPDAEPNRARVALDRRAPRHYALVRSLEQVRQLVALRARVAAPLLSSPLIRVRGPHPTAIIAPAAVFPSPTYPERCRCSPRQHLGTVQERASIHVDLDLSVRRSTLTLLHETPSPSSDWTARQPYARGWLG